MDVVLVTDVMVLVTVTVGGVTGKVVVWTVEVVVDVRIPR